MDSCRRWSSKQKKSFLTKCVSIICVLFLIAGCDQIPKTKESKITLSHEYVPPTPTVEPTPSPTPMPLITMPPIEEILPIEPEENDQLDRRTAWMEKAKVDDDWYADSEVCGELMNRLVNQYGLSLEAACGIVSNAWHESHWTPDIYARDGSYCYGLFQWLGVRLTRMLNWCAENDYDSSTVEGQTAYLVHELERYAVDLSGSAYECAYSFCIVFEAPPNASYQANIRGNYADELYWSFVG